MSSDEQLLAAWIERNVGGHVMRVGALQRWRKGWDVDVERDGRIIPLHARGERERNFAIPYRIADEVPIHDLLERHGLPVPHAYGLCDEPYALVMDRLAGDVDLSFASSDDARIGLIDEYLALLPAIYAIGHDELEREGFVVPGDAEGIALGSLRRFESVYDELMPHRDPVAEFLRGWLHRNYPQQRTEATFVTFDAFQFMFDADRITGLIDFELACVGDPMMDLASLRIRDTIKNLGDLAAIASRYEDITGVTVDHDAADFYAVLYNTLTVLSAGPPLATPERTTDYVSHLAWYVNSARWAFEVIAEMRRYELTQVGDPESSPSRDAPAFEHLARVLGARSREARDDYELNTLARHARYLRRIDEIGETLLNADLADGAALIGRRPAAAELDGELLALIDRQDPALDAALVPLLDRRVQRMQLRMASPGSLLLRHPRLRHLRAEVADEIDDAQRWPAGAIPGTR